MKIQEAIQKAIEGGYKDDGFILDSGGMDYSHCFLDPEFWKCLGKSMGWIDKDYPNGEMRCESPKCDSRYCEYAGYRNPLNEWKNLIHYLYEGKSIEDYFNQL